MKIHQSYNIDLYLIQLIGNILNRVMDDIEPKLKLSKEPTQHDIPLLLWIRPSSVSSDS